MKKLFTSVLAIAATVMSYAQYEFKKTDYVGAFGGTDWTQGWTNFNPNASDYLTPSVTTGTISGTCASCKSNAFTLNGNIDNEHVTVSGTILLRNKVYVKGGGSITIMPGSVIRGDLSTASTLIITTEGKIYAEGTVSMPIVFTSGKTKGSRGPGDWGGIVILGKAGNNQDNTAGNTTPTIEGLTASLDTEYGGTDDDHNSGILKYCRIEFGGFPLEVDKEINGLTMGSVGRGTTIEYIMATYNFDDSYEWFGGTVNAKYLISYKTTDDDFDSDFGWRGHVQFGLIIRDPNTADECTCSSSEGFESDNDASGSANAPLTQAIFSNITAFGPYHGFSGDRTQSINSKHERALRIRRRSSISVYNSLFVDWRKGLHYDGSASEGNFVSGSSRFRNNIFSNMTTFFSTTNSESYFATTGGENMTMTGNGMTFYKNPYTLPYDFSLACSSPLVNEADYSDSKFASATATTSGTTMMAITTLTGMITSTINGIQNITSVAGSELVTGKDLQGAVSISLVSAVAGFEMSLDGSTFTTSVVTLPGNCTLSQRIYARYVGTATSTINTGTIRIQGANTSAYDLLLSTGTIAGLVTVVGPVVTVTTSALASSDSDAVISVYPNPTENGEVTVVAPVGTAIVIYDLSGSVVKSATAVDNKTSISGLTPGFYIVKAGSKSLKLIVK